MTLPLSGARARPSHITNAIAAYFSGQMIGQEVGTSAETSDSSTFTTTETQIGAVTFSEVLGNVYRIRVPVQLSSATVTDIVQATLREDSIAGAEVHSGRGPMQTSDEARPFIIYLEYRYTATATGSKTFVVTGDRIAGGGNCKREAGTTHPQRITVTRVA